MFDTPILFLVFNRPETTKQVFEIIKEIKPSYLFIAADGPRVEREDDVIKCKEVREIVSNIDWDCQVKTLFRQENLGCGTSVNQAIDWFFEHVEQGIILEDDCLPEISFFEFCQKVLTYYSSNEKIKMICGTNYLFNRFDNSDSFFFSKFSLIWGWATWRRVWVDFKRNFDFSKLDDVDQLLQSRFEDKHLLHWYKMMYNDIIQSKINTWDIQFAYYIYAKDGLSVIPYKNQVRNIGYIGTHMNNNLKAKFFNMPVKSINLNNVNFTPDIKQNKYADKYVSKGIVMAHELKPDNWLIRKYKKVFRVK